MQDKLEKHIDLLIQRYPNLKSIRENIVRAYLVLEECYENGGKLLIAVIAIIAAKNR